MSSCTKEANKKIIGIIGCGASGLAALKNFAAEDSLFKCVAFEQTASIGGTWVYTDDIDRDQYGLPVHSSMYKSLRSNLPKEIMELSGFPHTGVGDACYFPASYIQKYLNDFTDHFNLRPYIKFNHHVEKVRPINDSQWEVNVLNLQQKSKETFIFDALLICVGNPAIPDVKGSNIFSGKIMHSHSYRDADLFKGNSVLVIGCGASGLDISFGASKVADKVFLSHHNPRLMKLKIPSNYFHKTDVKEIVEDGVIFQDGSYEKIDTIVYCTGYTYKYPFLSNECGINVENNHMINIEYPTMAFIGVPRNTTGFYLFDFQSRIFKKILEGSVKLPDKREMLQDTYEEIEARLASGQRLKDLHALGKTKWAMHYYTTVSKFAGVEHPPPVLLQIYFDGLERLSEDFLNFRGDKYQIIDREHYKSLNLLY
ncbi:senecionine N-oxygenase-like isoform X1 [Aphis craccivora]|uniref:Flavin-containing monooxygenase n=1 Tax=Aphis craccivora TaxID=307492 RepID=A0A6G0YGZ8_APHCR|nr:senecionine N-oxygenase-like isoform X1 [Aphis craccivora]